MTRFVRTAISLLVVMASLVTGSACTAPAAKAPLLPVEPSSHRPAPPGEPDTGNPAAVQRRSTVVAAVGDIAPPQLGRQQQTYRLARDWNPSAVLVLGDVQYPSGKLTHLRRYYAPNWGRLKGRTRPVPGNHDYRQRGARGYFSYFGKRAAPQGRSYYSFNLNGWHLVALNSEIRHSRGSAQLRWLRADLARNKHRCVLAYWHRPRFSSGKRHGSNRSVAPFWDALYRRGGDVVLNGHEHLYERFGHQSPAGKPTSRGIRQFVVGTGGVSRYPFGKPARSSQVRLNKHYGVLRLVLQPGGYSWQFISVDGKVRDRGSNRCR